MRGAHARVPKLIVVVLAQSVHFPRLGWSLWKVELFWSSKTDAKHLLSRAYNVLSFFLPRGSKGQGTWNLGLQVRSLDD